MNGSSLRALLTDAAATVRAAPGRASLSALAIAIGAASLTVLLAALGGLSEQARGMVRELGADTFAIVPDSRAAATAPLRPEHTALLRASVPRAEVTAVRRFEKACKIGRDEASVVQTDPSFAPVRQRAVREGRFLDERDMVARARHAVVTRTLADRAGLRPGSTVLLRRMPFTVVGVLDDGPSLLPGDSPMPEQRMAELGVFVPLTTPAYWSPQVRPLPALDALFVRGAAMAAGEALHRTREILTFAADDPPAALWVSPDYIVRKVSRLQAVVRWTAGTVTVLSLSLGGAMLFALMLVSVRERVAEIGLRRSLGATPADIAGQFLAEALLATIPAGLAGAGLAFGLLSALRGRMPLPLELAGSTLLTAFAATAVVAVAFTLIPALRAARIAPAEALRNE